MRIVCQKCSAAYAIDDKFVTPKGVRAQCPRCRHLQLVKKEEAAAPPPAAAPASDAPSPFLFDMAKTAPAPAHVPAAGSDLHFGQVPPPPNAPQAAAPFSFDFGGPPPPPPGGAAPASAGFDFGAPPPPAPPPAAAPAPAPFDFGAPPPPSPAGFDFGGPPPPEPSPFDFGGPPPPAPGGPGTGAALDDLMGGAPAPAPQQGVKCKTCGKLMTDPFDQALGICDECRNKAQEQVSKATPDSGEGQKVERIDASGLHQKLTSAPSLPKVTSTAPPPAKEPNFDAPPPSGAELVAVRSALRAREESGRGKTIGIVVAIVAVVAGGVFLAIKRPWAKKPVQLVVKNTGGAKPVEAIVQQWRLNYPELEGESSKTANKFIDDGEELLAKDTTQSYLDAEEEFQKALVLDPQNDRAVAGWALALAFGRGAAADENTIKAAESMLTASEQRNSSEARLFVAHAHLLIARNGTPNDIKYLAERGKSSSSASDKALASLAIGQTFLTKNPQLAEAAFKEALQLDPKLKRAYFFQAQHSAQVGKYRDAIASLEKRLELDKDQWEAAEELARLYVDVGEVPKAKKVLEAAKAAAPGAARPRLGLAMLSYQVLGDTAGAGEQLTALLGDAEIRKGERADALVHLAAVERLQGDAAKASDTIDKALELSPELVAAKLQKFLILLDKGVASSARLELDSLKGKLNDKYLEATLEGRLLIAEARMDDAIQTLAGIQDSDPRRVDALLLAGAAAAKARKDGKAWEFCLKRGLRADPGSRPVATLTHLYVRPADLLKPAVGAYAALVKSRDEDPNPGLCEGLVAWFSEDFSSADKHLARVTSIDQRNAPAYAYRALIALRRKDLAGAAKLAGRGLDSSKTNALVYLAQGQMALASNKVDAAKIAATNALKYGPQLPSAKVLQAEAEARLNEGEDARRTLTTVLLNDALFRDAKRVLYKHSL